MNHRICFKFLLKSVKNARGHDYQLAQSIGMDRVQREREERGKARIKEERRVDGEEEEEEEKEEESRKMKRGTKQSTVVEKRRNRRTDQENCELEG